MQNLQTNFYLNQSKKPTILIMIIWECEFDTKEPLMLIHLPPFEQKVQGEKHPREMKKSQAAAHK